MKFAKLVERCTSQIYEDESLRFGLTDAEAKITLGWASDWVALHIQQANDIIAAKRISVTEMTRVRDILHKLNQGENHESIWRG